jgi:fatty acid desaturase
MTDGLTAIIILVLFFIISFVIAVLSPFGIGFIVFSFLRLRGRDEATRRVSLVFQLVCAMMTLCLGTLMSLLFSIRGSPFYMYSQGILMTLGVVLATLLVVGVELGVIVWETHVLTQRQDAKKK